MGGFNQRNFHEKIPEIYKRFVKLKNGFKVIYY